jgi:DnaK suppressor protein
VAKMIRKKAAEKKIAKPAPVKSKPAPIKAIAPKAIPPKSVISTKTTIPPKAVVAPKVIVAPKGIPPKAAPAKGTAPRVVANSAPKVFAKAVASPPVQSSKPAKRINSHSTRMEIPARPRLAPVSTDGKPRKNQAGITSRELEMYRDLILAKRREIVGDMSSMEHEALRTSGGSNLSNLPIHMADMGTDNYEQEFTLGLVEKDRKLLRDLNDALAKIQNGTYGICEGTAKPISKARLEAQPWARYSIEYARKLEGRLR